jgi:hypothetical protein
LVIVEIEKFYNLPDTCLNGMISIYVRVLAFRFYQSVELYIIYIIYIYYIFGPKN